MRRLKPDQVANHTRIILAGEAPEVGFVDDRVEPGAHRAVAHLRDDELLHVVNDER